MKFFLSFFLLLFVAACTNTGSLVEPELSTHAVKEPKESILIDIETEQGLVDLIDPQSDPVSYENLWLKLAESFEFAVPDNARI
ncbi:MAG TPA: lytic transglycosylase, partial [Psychromonas sp.]